MDVEKLWLIAEGGEIIRLNKNKDGIFREPITPKMIFLPQRHVLDISMQDEVEMVCPYHFKGKTINILLLGIAIGIFAGGIFNIEPIITAIVILSFAVTTLLFQSTGSEYTLIRMSGSEGQKCAIIKTQDIPDLQATHENKFRKNPNPTPSKLDEEAARIVETQRYGFATTASAISAIAMAEPVAESIYGQKSMLEAIATCVLFTISLGFSALGATKVIMSYMHRIKGKIS